jgi:U3 small nucleolar ribonucleoprotein protein LCP5
VRGGGAGDLVDALVEGRVVLDRARALEGRMRYQIEKLVRMAQDAEHGRSAAADGQSSHPLLPGLVR